MEHTPKAHAELEVTGVSRSGRVCKKSSKLMDFQSPDDITDAKQKKAAAAQKSKHSATGSAGTSGHSGGSGLMHLTDALKEEFEELDDDELPSDSGGDDGDDSSGSEDDDDAMDIEDLEGTQEEDDKSDGELLVEMAPKRSLYMSEKSSKYKKVLKDGKVVMGKSQRKDKGKRRFTAYILWAKEARKQMMSNPDLDFASMSKRLGEMWANVPSNQKYNWKRRARRIAKKYKEGNDKAAESPVVKRFLNLDQQIGTPVANPAPVAAPVTPVVPHATPRNKKAQQKANATAVDTKPVVHHSPESPTKSAAAHGKLPGYQPTDVAAHLKLLGDSLTIIGERLKEHEGQIAVSGSLSVLLDSLLCSLGPLMCLTVHIPGLQADAEHLKDLFQNTLDNIAYVMPGL
ncbi:HMG box-containing protein 4 [Culex quinquefasciatus]|uniref:HMG box-containing protein 4 n=1 Tax=Culex quinquefasciatus TaxID=7176 RepID=UPI0018E3F845|nr:HMG box-containing protein 4 [Culex quinquefasciatus]